MTAKEPKRVSLVWLLILAGLAALIVHDIANATDDECRGHSCNDGGDVDIDIDGGDVIVPVDVTTGPVSVDNPVTVNTGGNTSRALALSNSLGDVDINNGMASEQWATPLFSKQEIILNEWSAALIADSFGNHEQAARMRCGIKAIKRLYRTSGKWIFSKYDMTNCESDWTFHQVAVEPAPVPAMSASRDDEEDDSRYDELYALVVELENRAPQVVVKQAMPDQVQQQIDDGADRRARARAAKAEILGDK